MPRSQYVSPDELRRPGKITFTDIPVNTYQKTVAEAKRDGTFTDADFRRIYRDMVYIREFETMLNLIKTRGEYQGVAYNYPGPAHLSMGQEASAVGTAFVLEPEDFTFGSHRSHGELIAKAMSAIHQMDDASLIAIMRAYFDGEILRRVEGNQPSTKALAEDFFLYGSIAEIFGRETGFNKGLGGSMHTFFTPFGIYPNNALVGGSGDIAMGAALFKRVNRKPGIVVANFGDGAVGCGPVWEAMNFAAMDQLSKLWDDDMKGGLPVLFNIYNNAYGMGGQTRGETMAYDLLARIGAGIAPNQLNAERVDGFNPLAVIEATARKKKALLNREGPALLDVVTYRFGGHSPSDASTYRTKEEIDAWMAVDPLIIYRSQLVEAGVATETECDTVLAEASAAVFRAFEKAVSPDISPRLDLRKNPDAIGSLMFTNGQAMKLSDRAPEVLGPKEENPRVQAIAKKVRFHLDSDGKPVSKNRVYQFRDALFEAIIDKYYEDATLISYGEDVRDWGGAFAVYRGLTEAVPYHRLFNAPISEGAIVGSAVGYAMCGGRALVELMYCDFLGRAGDQVFNQMSKWQAMSADVLNMPVVLRVSVGSKYGAQHSQDWSSLCAHIPGLKVVFPATPYDAKGILNAALSGTDPVVFLESQRVYDFGEMFHEGGVPEGYYEIPIGEPDIKRAGGDITILSVGATLYRVMDAAKALSERYGVEAEVIDARSLVPFDYELLLKSVKKTGRLVLASDACARGSFLSDIARNVTEMAFDDLDAPPVVVGARNWITPAHELEETFFPQVSWILDAIHEKILPQPGHTVTTNQSVQEQKRLARIGE